MTTLVKFLLVATFAACGDMGQPDYFATFYFEPDFLTVDQVGRQKDAVQFFIPSVSNPQYIVRGSEIACSNGLIVVREAGPPTGTPCSGGWGPIVYETEYEVHGRVMSFTIPMEVTGGLQGYDIERYYYGWWYTGWMPSCDCRSRGPGQSYDVPPCTRLDFDEDGDIDLFDFYLEQWTVQ